MEKFLDVDICGRIVALPIMSISDSLDIAFFNLHGNASLTEFCGKEIAKRLDDIDVVITAESKGLQLGHCVARELGHEFYCVARKTKKLYMQDGICSSVQSITTKEEQVLYLSNHDVSLLKGKNVAIVDDVISTGGSLLGLEKLVQIAGGNIAKKIAVLAEGDARDRTDIEYLAGIPLMFK